MTTEEMRGLGKDAAEWIDTEMINKIVSVLWTCCAEICERLDLIADQISKSNRND